MYMHEGKPIQVPYGRRNVGVTKLQLESIVDELIGRIEALEAKVYGTSEPLEVTMPEPVPEPEVEQESIEEPETSEPSIEPERPKRGCKPKEAQE